MCHELLLLKDAAQKADNWRNHVILVQSVSSSDIFNCWVWFFLQNVRDAQFCQRFSSPNFDRKWPSLFSSCSMSYGWPLNFKCMARWTEPLSKRGAMDGGVDGISTDKEWEIQRFFGRVPACSSNFSQDRLTGELDGGLAMGLESPAPLTGSPKDIE